MNEANISFDVGKIVELSEKFRNQINKSNFDISRETWESEKSWTVHQNFDYSLNLAKSLSVRTMLKRKPWHWKKSVTLVAGSWFPFLAWFGVDPACGIRLPFGLPIK